MIEVVGTPQTWGWALQMVLPREASSIEMFGGCPRGAVVPVIPNALHYSEITIKSDVSIIRRSSFVKRWTLFRGARFARSSDFGEGRGNSTLRSSENVLNT